MGKRSTFERRPMDSYATPYAGVVPLAPHLHGIRTFAEPCCGDGDLVEHLTGLGLLCVHSGDIVDGRDALDECHFNGPDAIITNPPWTRPILHEMIGHFQRIAPTWLLFDADWAHTRQAAPFLDQCSHVVSVGRLKWIEDSKYTGKDNCAWYRFHAQHVGGPRFIGRPVPALEAA
jgi:hypothetical protein